MEPSSRHEEHIGRDAIGGIPSISNTNVSGVKHTCQSCGITASGSKPTPSSSSKTASGPSSTSSSSSKTASGHEPAPSANLSASGPEHASAVDGPENVRHVPCGLNTTGFTGFTTASFIHSGVNAASFTPSGANIASFTPFLSDPEPSRLSRATIERMSDSEEARLAAFEHALAGTSTAKERVDLLFSWIRSPYPQTEAPQTPVATIAAPAPTQPIAHEDWSTYGGWPTESDWSTQNTWSTYPNSSTPGGWPTQSDWANWSTNGSWPTNEDSSTPGAHSTNPRPRGQAGRRQSRANRARRNRRN